MGFKDMKRDDHGHVIGKDEVDGQKCKHGAGGNNRQDIQNKLDTARNNLKKANDVENIAKYNREVDSLEKQLSTMPDDSFDDDYEEEFKDLDLTDRKTRDELTEVAENLDENKLKKMNQEREDKIEEGKKGFYPQENFDEGFEEVDDNLMDANNPKYKGFTRSHITNAKEVDAGETFRDYDKGEDRKLSIIEYIPYGALQDGTNRKLYGVVSNYDGSDAPAIGAIVSPDLESAKEDLKEQIELGKQGSERYLKRGKWDEEFFNILKDDIEGDDSEEIRGKYSKKYGWDFSKPWNEQKHMKPQSMGVRDDVMAMRNEFYGLEPEEVDAILKNLNDRDAKEAKIKNNVDKFNKLMKQGKKEEAKKFLDNLSNEDVSYLFERVKK